MLGSTPQTTSSVSSALDLGGSGQEGMKKTDTAETPFSQALDEQVRESASQGAGEKAPQSSDKEAAGAAPEGEAEQTAGEAPLKENSKEAGEGTKISIAKEESAKLEMDAVEQIRHTASLETEVDSLEIPSSTPVPEELGAASTSMESGKNLPPLSAVLDPIAKRAEPGAKTDRSEAPAVIRTNAEGLKPAAGAEEADIELMQQQGGQTRSRDGLLAAAMEAAGAKADKTVPFESLMQAIPRASASSGGTAPPVSLNPVTTALGMGLASTAAALPEQALHVRVPVQHSAWDAAMGERVLWMARQGMQQAQIQLNPRELGPIEIRIQVSNDQANVSFVAQHAQTREALDTALPRLREMFQEQGLNLNDASVSQQSKQQERQQEGGEAGRKNSAMEPLNSPEGHEQSAGHIQSGIGMLDFYA